MKLIETITETQIDDALVNKTVLPLFSKLSYTYGFNFATEYAYSLSLEYYLSRSANKTISPIFKKLIELKGVEKATEYIQNIIHTKFKDKWNRIYDTYVEETYEVLNGLDFKTTKQGTNTENTEHSDTFTYENTSNDESKVSTKETTTTNNKTEEEIYGFNSVEGVNANDTTDNGSVEVVGLQDDNKRNTKTEKSGTETKGITENKENNNNEESTRSGRVTSGSSLIDEEMKLRLKTVFTDIVLKDYDSIVTLQIY